MNTKRPKYSNLEFIKDLWYFLKIYKWQLIFLTILLAISMSPALISPIIISKIIDFFVIGGKSINLFYIYLGALIGVGVIGTFMRHSAKYYLALFTNKIRKSAKIESFQKVLQGDLVWHDKETTGAKMEKIMSGDRALGSFMDFYINKGIKIVTIIVGVIGVFAFFNIKYALMAILFSSVYLLAEFKLNRKVVQKTFEQRIAEEIATGKAYEFSSNISTIKSLGIEQSSGKQIISKEEKVLRVKNARRKASTFKWIIVQLIALFFFVLFIFLVGKDILAGILTIGAIIIYIDYIRRLREVLNSISVEVNRLIDIKYSLYRMMQIYKSIPDLDEKDAKDLKGWKEIKIENLEFRYRKEGIIDELNLNIKKREKIGVVGKSGSGKSTLFKLLLKLYLPRKGGIYFDKKPINKIKRDSLLNKISVVPQETELFNLSLRENITISSKGKINAERYKKALLISQTDQIIKKLKNKDLTLIGEKGVRLSGGERQRLGIARAIYKDSEMIILDEATSNLDYETEKKILESIEKHLKNKTLIISAHRLQTLKDMDKILVIEKGKITEQGTYNELLKKKGKFYRISRAQKGWRN